MRHIWAPWRMAYIEGTNEESECLFCTQLTKRDGPDNLILHRGERAFIILNRYPYNNGHMMVVPITHRASLDDLDPETQVELMQLASRAVTVLRQVYGAESFNLGVNIGQAAGAGVADHVHMHVLARWPGDTSFMATTAETRVIPESLRDTYSRLRPAWQSLSEAD